jgi:hypothetical protein
LVLLGIQTVVVALLALLVVGLLRSHAAILRQLHEAGLGLDDLEPASGSGVGSVPLAPPEVRTRPGVPQPGSGARGAVDVVGTSVRGSTVSVSASAGPTLLAFLTTGCTTCQGFWRDLAGGADLPAGMRLAIVTKGDEAEDGRAVAALAPAGVTTLRSSAAWADYAVPASPYFVLVDGGQVIGEGAALTWQQVRDLLERAAPQLRSKPAGDRRRWGHLGRLQDTDAELLAAGLRPGDPSLFAQDPGFEGP